MKLLHINRIGTTFMTVAAIGLFGFSGVLLARAWPTLSRVATHHETRDMRVTGQCRNLATKFGFQAQEQAARLSISMPKSAIGDLKQNFDYASIVVAACDGYTLETFCAGNGCGSYSLTMSLREVNRVTQSR